MSNPGEVTLISEDGIKFQVRIQVVRCIGLFKNLLELHLSMGNINNSTSAALPPLQVPNVNSLILDKIIEYLNNYTASRENSALTTKPSSARVKNIISGIQNKTIGNDDDDDDDNVVEDDESIEIGPVSVDDENDFEIPSEDENVFDFANFDEQSLKLFTPYEQNFFGSLDIPTLIEITKVSKEERILKIKWMILFIYASCLLIHFVFLI